MKTSFLPLVLLLSFFATTQIQATADTGNMPQGAVHKMLEGKWQVTINADELPQAAREENAAPDNADFAVITYRFADNGALTRSVQRGAARWEESGEWQLTEDGRYISFHFSGKAAVQAEIKYIEADEMVLAQPSGATDSNLQNEVRQLYFTKM
ncbi:MAG: hypothetical protein IAE84_05110 [Saprospiraceae bacterium]|jgi:hypothetical protein|nr:hypothetical protein [Saprospiraceae bacterium]HRD80013.1 hypothetical protein [Saprospiraceae bacterium]HRF37174.1 hypothetical protein [Saprospiraceae bacterium]HRK80513.1 hypothetical protein [Saprospiraceae bacterium]